MTSSGMKRGLAAVAVSALSVTGLPLLAGTASAQPIADNFGANAVGFYSQQVAGISAKNDGTNTTVSLVTGGGANVTSVLYQYEVSTAVGTWVDVPGGLVARNADGVFAFDWANPPATVTRVRAVPNTGLGNAVDVAAPTIPTLTANTVELATEGALGFFRSPYTEAPGDFVGATGTVSSNVAVTVSDVSNGTDSVGATVTDDGDATTTETFDAVLDISGYPYSAGTEANQIALNAATNNTDDAEGSTLYAQTINGITATPATQEIRSGGTAEIVIKVVDQNGKPVANAQIGEITPDGADAGTEPDSAPIGFTDGKGEFVDTQTTAGTYTYYVNVNDDDAFNAGVDKSTSVTVSVYTPFVDSVAIGSRQNRTAFDLDEIADGDDFTITTKDQRGKAYDETIAGNDVEYRWIIDPSGAGDTVTTAWMGDAVDNGDGTYSVPGLDDTDYPGGLPVGSYTLEARRPNVGGSGLRVAAPATFNMGESEISYAEGTSANAPVNGSFTVDGTLALGDGTGLGGREVQLTYTPGGDSTFAPQAQQPAGVTVVSPTSATAVTDANGKFSVKLMDQPIPANVTPTPENGTLNAIAEESATDTTSLQGNNGPNDSTTANDPANAEQDLVIHWITQPVAKTVEISSDALIDGLLTPGRPADLDIVVKDASGAPLQDFPVTVSVDHGFLSPNAETAGALTPAAGAADNGDLYGVWKNDGASKTVSTGDDKVAGAVAAIERDAAFDDDGLVTMVVTVKAGDVTQTKSITFNSDDPLNSGGLELKRMAGEPTGSAVVGDSVEYNVFAKDQFGNLAGSEEVRVLDNTTLADFTTDDSEDKANTDFANDSESITATASAPVAQTLEGRWNTESNVWQGGARSESLGTVSDTDTINWVSGRVAIEALLKLGNQADGDDVARVNAPSAAAGATVKLYKIRKDGTRKLIATKTANANGNAKFVVDDKNGQKYTKYQAKVGKTAKTFADWTPKKRVR